MFTFIQHSCRWFGPSSPHSLLEGESSPLCDLWGNEWMNECMPISLDFVGSKREGWLMKALALITGQPPASLWDNAIWAHRYLVSAEGLITVTKHWGGLSASVGLNCTEAAFACQGEVTSPPWPHISPYTQLPSLIKSTAGTISVVVSTVRQLQWKEEEEEEVT